MTGVDRDVAGWSCPYCFDLGCNMCRGDGTHAGPMPAAAAVPDRAAPTGPRCWMDTGDGRPCLLDPWHKGYHDPAPAAPTEGAGEAVRRAVPPLIEVADDLGAEVMRLRADNDRLRKRIHEAVDECQRRYAPGVKELGRLLSVRNTARRYFEDHKAKGEEWSWWALTSEVARAFVANVMDERDALRDTLERIEALAARLDREGFPLQARAIRKAAALPPSPGEPR